MIGVPKHSFRPVINDGSTAVPPHGIMHVTRIDSEGFAHVTEPTLSTPIELILVNGSSYLESNSRGSGHQSWPANVAYDLKTGDTPANGEAWGIEEGNWKLVKCLPGFIVVGGPGHGAVTVVPQYARRIKARITSRTESTCGNSGSGAGDTDHTLYTYTLHSVRAVDDGDGCPAFVLDEVDTATIIEEAYEQNSNLVAVGTVVDAELVTYSDESVSGSGVGPIGCRWVFSVPSFGGGDPCVSVFRYFCEVGVLKEYSQDCNGILTFVRNVGCCLCDTPSGSLCECTPPDSVCVTIGTCITRTLPLVDSTASYARYSSAGGGTDQYPCTLTYEIYFGVDVECTGFLSFSNPFFPLSPDGCCNSWAQIETASCTFPVTGTMSGQASGDSFTISSGECSGDVGSGAGDCPCLWQWNGILPWVLVAGDAGSCVAPMSSGTGSSELRYTNTDGTTCTPTGGDGGDLTCACTGDKLATATLQDGFLADVPATAMRLVLQPGTFCFWQSIADVFTACGQGNRSIMAWEEGGRLYATVVGSGQVFEAEDGSTCDDMTFLFSYTTANTICPGEVGTMTLNVVTE